MALEISLSITTGSVGDLVTVSATSGTFSIPYNTNVVTFNGAVATILSGDSTDLIVRVPILASTGKVTAENFVDEISLSTSDFTVVYEEEIFGKRRKTPFDKGVINQRVKTVETNPSESALYNRDMAFTKFVEITDENSMIQNFFSIILTNKGERIWEPEFGTNIQNLIFRLLSDPDTLETEIVNEITEAVKQYESRIQVIQDQSIVMVNTDTNRVDAIIAIRVPSGTVREVGVTLGIIDNELQ